ncbi:MAG: hypothetical protein ACLTYW_00595 [Collinsella sp.]
MMTFTYLGREGQAACARVGRACARDGRHGRGRRPHHAFEGEAPMAVARPVPCRCAWEPLPLRAGDHAVVLSYSPVMLIGGGRVLLSRCRRSRELTEGSACCTRRSSPAISRAVWALGWAADAAVYGCRCYRGARSCCW